MRRIEQTVADTITEYGMIPPDIRIVVGVSGGADSIALLHYLHTHFPDSVIAAHVNHCLRGAESERDEQFVRSFCASQGIPLFVCREEVAVLAKERKQSIEDCGRAVRYDFFYSLLKSDTDRIATAHTLSDTAETVLFHLARGSGVKGLAGIPPVRGQIIRPLISITREEVEQYCQHYGLSYVEDSTNASLEYTRNRIRHRVIPAMAEVHPGFFASMHRLTRQMAEQDEAMTYYSEQLFQSAKTPFGYDITVLQTAPKGTVLHGLSRLLRQQGAGDALSEEKLEQLYACILQGSGGVTVRKALVGYVQQGVLLFAVPNPQPDREERSFAPPQQVCKLGKVLSVSVDFMQNCKISENNFYFLFPNSLDYDTIPTGAVWRTRRPGDTFRPVGRGVTKSLSGLFQEHRVPAALRDSLLVLAAGSVLLWAEGFGAAEQAAVTAKTERLVTINVQGGESDASSCGANSLNERGDCSRC